MALVDKTLPFTGVIRKDVFPQLSAIAPPSNFENYDLDTNPQTMDTTERSRPFHEKRERQEKEKTLAFMKLKWNRPFGWFESNNMGIPILGARREIKGFNLRKADVSKAFDTQESNYSSAAKWGWRALVVLLALFPPTLCFTIPLIREKEKKENAEKKELPVQKRIFTLEEYEDIRNTRAKLKELLKIAPQVSETKDEKFKKVCIAYNEKGEEVSYKYKVKKIEMYCDKYQAKRWDPTFLNSLIKKAKSESEKERKLARAEYILSKFNSETINSFPPFNSFTR